MPDVPLTLISIPPELQPTKPMMKRRRERHKNTPTERRRCSSANNPASPRRSAVRPVSHRLVVLPPAGSRALEKLTASGCEGSLGHSRVQAGLSASKTQRASRGPGPRRRPGIGNLPRDREMPTMPQSRPLPRLEIPHADVEMGHWEHTRVRHPFNGQHWVPLLHIPFTSLLSARSRRSVTVPGVIGRRAGGVARRCHSPRTANRRCPG